MATFVTVTFHLVCPTSDYLCDPSSNAAPITCQLMRKSAWAMTAVLNGTDFPPIDSFRLPDLPAFTFRAVLT